MVYQFVSFKGIYMHGINWMWKQVLYTVVLFFGDGLLATVFYVIKQHAAIIICMWNAQLVIQYG